MKLRTSKLLGLALTDREAACAVLAGGRLRSAARWSVPAGLSLANPKEYGTALRTFLEANGMGDAGRAIVGVPARWLITDSREVPPVDRSEALASLRLQAERISLGDDAKLVFDAAGRFDGQGAGHAVLVGLAESQLDRIRQACEAARLEPVAITATGLVLADAMAGGDEDRLLILSEGDAAELVWQSPRGPRALRHVTATGPGAAASVWRGLTTTGFTGNRIELIGDASSVTIDRDQLAERLGQEVDQRDPAAALNKVPAVSSLNGKLEDVVAQRLWPAVALAGTGAATLPVNFLRPALAPPKPARIDRRWVLGIGFALAAVLGIYWLWSEAVAAEQLRDELEAKLVEIQPDIAASEAEIARVTYGRTFFKTRPPMLDCLSELASAFEHGEPIWTTAFTMRDNGRAQLQGRAGNQLLVLQLRDRLVANPNFTLVQLIDLREATGAGGQRGQGGEMGFTLSFNYVGPSDSSAGSDPS